MAANWTNYPIGIPNPTDTFLFGNAASNLQISAKSLVTYIQTNLPVQTNIATNLPVQPNVVPFFSAPDPFITYSGILVPLQGNIPLVYTRPCYGWYIWNTGQPIPLYTNGTNLNNSTLTGANTADFLHAWSIQNRADGVVIGVLSGGVDTNCFDLPNNAKLGAFFNYNPNDITTTNAISTYEDAQGDGTEIANIIAAIPGNGVGIAGVSPGATVYNVWPYISGSDLTAATNFLLGFNYCVSKNCSIILFDYGLTDWRVHNFYGPPSAWYTNYTLIYNQLFQACSNYVNLGGIIVEALPNNNLNYWNTNNAGCPDIPGEFVNFGLCNIVLVTGVGMATNLYIGSTGTNIIGGPGAYVASTGLSNIVNYESGTSMALPQVGGLLALLKSYCPTASSTQLVQMVYNGCVPVIDSNNLPLGQINAYNTMLAAQQFNLTNSTYINSLTSKTNPVLNTVYPHFTNGVVTWTKTPTP